MYENATRCIAGGKRSAKTAAVVESSTNSMLTVLLTVLVRQPMCVILTVEGQEDSQPLAQQYMSTSQQHSRHSL
jgi:hypothetical protein